MRSRIYSVTLSLGLILSMVVCSNAQIGMKPIEHNNSISAFLNSHDYYSWKSDKLNKHGQLDTLELPFFDDFTIRSIYPDSTKWLDNLTYRNDHFAIKPPSYGVATFDYLDEFGNAYSSLEENFLDYADSLTSQAINLNDSSGVPYNLSDSFHLSFYYQGSGNGDFLKERDSLYLFFLDENGNWRKVWEVGGEKQDEFSYVILPILDQSFLHPAFQFRFVNFSYRWGNNNHWHLDHIYLNKRRSINETSYDDYAVQSVPSSLLKRYASMPYDHFMEDPSGEGADSVYFQVSNLSDVVINALVRYEERHDGVLLKSTNFSDNAANVAANGSAVRKSELYGLGGLMGNPVVIERTYYVKESGRTNPVLFQNNDQIKTTQIFSREFAYDDGSAESGFGFNDLRNAEGQMAIKFELNKPDSLRGISIHFTQNIEDVSRVFFNLRVWRELEFNGAQEELLYDQLIGGAQYTDTINGFHYFALDTPLYLPRGKFFVGWYQDDNYNLTVGFDRNWGNLANTPSINEDIFFNIGEGWQVNDNEDLQGAPMIRPLVGSQQPWAVSTHEVLKVDDLKIYPNPTSSLINIESEQPLESIALFDMSGRMVLSRIGNTSLLDISSLEKGKYLLKVSYDNGISTHKKVVKY